MRRVVCVLPPPLTWLAVTTWLVVALSPVVSSEMRQAAGESSQGTLNAEALRRMHFRQAQPPGCKGPGEDAKGRWCEIMKDGGVTVRNVDRLREVVKAAEKRASSGKLAEGSDGLAEMRREIIAGRAAAVALETAVAKFDKAEKIRLGSKATKTGPASGKIQREADHFKCRKDLKEQDVEKLKYICIVTEYKLKRDKAKAGGNGKGESASREDDDGKAKMSNDERCAQLTQWLSKYNSDSTDGKTKFWKWLSKNHASFESLEKLKEHSQNAGTGSGKVRAAIESKATKTYKSLSREIHPDKLGAFFRKTPKCNTPAVKDMLRTVFDRATDLKNCVIKPLRCDLKAGNSMGHDEF